MAFSAFTVIHLLIIFLHNIDLDVTCFFASCNISLLEHVGKGRRNPHNWFWIYSLLLWLNYKALSTKNFHASWMVKTILCDRKLNLIGGNFLIFENLDFRWNLREKGRFFDKTPECTFDNWKSIKTQLFHWNNKSVALLANTW